MSKYRNSINMSKRNEAIAEAIIQSSIHLQRHVHAKTKSIGPRALFITITSIIIKMGHGIQAGFVYHHEHRHQDEVTAGRGFPRATSPTIDRTKRCLS
jgi:hypothetical protein